MSRQDTWRKRIENATQYANEAVCQKCKYAEWIRTAAFCSGRGRPRKLTQKAWESNVPGFCPEYAPKCQIL